MRTNSIPDIEFLERYAGRMALGSERGRGSNHFLRFKIVGHRLTIDQAKTIAWISEKFGRGYLEVTTRGSIQVHWIRDEDAPEIFSKMDEVGLATDMCGQAFPIARYGDVRNIVTCPVTGIQKGELIDTYPLVRRLSEYFSGNPNYLDLPRKFKIAITSCPIKCVRPEIHDLVLIAVEKEGRVGFTPLIGGRLGEPPYLAKPMNIFLEPGEVFEFVRSVVEVYRDHGPRDQKATARFAHMVDRVGVGGIKALLKEYLTHEFEEFHADVTRTQWGDHIGVNEQKQLGLYYIVIPLPAGMIHVTQFKKIIDLVEERGYELRTSPLQKLILVNVKEEELKEVEEFLSSMGFDLYSPPIRWTSLGCPADMCGKALEPPKEKVLEIEQHLERVFGEKLKRLRVSIAISGCPHSCAHHKISEIGLQSKVVRANGSVEPAYDVYIGVASSKLSRRFLTNVPSRDVKFVIERIVASYLESGLQDFREFGERLLRGDIGWS